MFGFGLKESFSLEIESTHKHENILLLFGHCTLAMMMMMMMIN